jgi:hypothetical protein
MHPKMLGSGKSEGFVPIHDLEQCMGSFGQEQAGGLRGTRGRIVTEDAGSYDISEGASWTAHIFNFCFLLFGSDAAHIIFGPSFGDRI